MRTPPPVNATGDCGYNHYRGRCTAGICGGDIAPLIQETDLRGITRRSDIAKTIVMIKLNWEVTRTWLIFGEAQLRQHDGRRQGEALLTAYMRSGVTDFEHDSSYTLQLPLIGLTFENVFYHTAHFKAWIDPTQEKDGFNDFRVPLKGYDPTTHPDAYTCEECQEPHIIVPEGFYCPPTDYSLYDAVKGKEVDIRITLARE